MVNIKKKLEKNIVVLSPYSEDHDSFVEVSALKYSFECFTSSSQLYNFLQESALNYIVLISSKIDDDFYNEIVKKTFKINNDTQIIIYSKYASVEEVSSVIQLGVSHFSVGENCFFDAVSTIDEFFHDNFDNDF